MDLVQCMRKTDTRHNRHKSTKISLKSATNGVDHTTYQTQARSNYIYNMQLHDHRLTAQLHLPNVNLVSCQYSLDM